MAALADQHNKDSPIVGVAVICSKALACGKCDNASISFLRQFTQLILTG